MTITQPTSYSIIIPSRTPSNLSACVKSIRDAGETARIIVVNDFDHKDRGALIDLAIEYQLTVIGGVKPFIFSRNINLGIAAVGSDDVILLNDDAIIKHNYDLLPPNPIYAFSDLVSSARECPEYGVVSASCNTVGNVNQHCRRQSGIRDEPRMVCFIAVYIPRSTINTVGLLDERFIDYGMDDDDYCERVRRAGLKIGIYDFCFVDHGSLTSTYRGTPNQSGDFRPNLRRYIEKWGVDNRGMSRETSPWKDLWE